MHTPIKYLPIVLIVAIACLIGGSVMSGTDTKTKAEKNKQLIQASFERWRAGTGGPFELLASEATWTITGKSLASKKYLTRDEFMDAVIKPFNARVTKPLFPTIRSLYTDGDTVIALFDGEAMAHDGIPYRNTYAWFMQMRDSKIINVTAFYDAHTFDDLWKRVPTSK